MPLSMHVCFCGMAKRKASQHPSSAVGWSLLENDGWRMEVDGIVRRKEEVDEAAWWALPFLTTACLRCSAPCMA